MRFSVGVMTAQNEWKLAYFHVGFNLLSLLIMSHSTYIPLAVLQLLNLRCSLTYSSLMNQVLRLSKVSDSLYKKKRLQRKQIYTCEMFYSPAIISFLLKLARLIHLILLIIYWVCGKLTGKSHRKVLWPNLEKKLKVMRLPTLHHFQANTTLERRKGSEALTMCQREEK